MVGSLAVWPLYKRQVSHLCGKTMYQLAQELRKKTRIADIHSDLESARELGWEPVSAANVRDQSPHTSGFYLFPHRPLKCQESHSSTPQFVGCTRTCFGD